jgi:hypothetical protein
MDLALVAMVAIGSLWSLTHQMWQQHLGQSEVATTNA